MVNKREYYVFIYLFLSLCKMGTRSIICLFAIVLLSLCEQAYYSPCLENAGRNCSSSTNRTDFLLSMKKGGTNVLSTQNYLYDFFLCEQYNYDCGYVPEKQAYATVANGVSLNITATQLADITTLTATQNKIKPYIGKQGDTAKCGMSIFPLMLTPAQSKQVLDGYMQILTTNVTSLYNADRNTSTTKPWSDININIRTAILQKLKSNTTMIRNSTFWTNICQNDYTGLSQELKQYYRTYDQQIDLHAAYLIDSVTQKCNKLQSVNFLVDQSGSIGAPGFQLALDFLRMYVNSTNDDMSIMSIHFYDGTFNPYIDYGRNKTYFLNMIASKIYGSGSTLTGKAINATIDKIIAGNFKKGLPKIMVVMTDGVSYDSVLQAANRARNQGIFSVAVGIGPNINDAQLLQIAGTSSNIIKISSYDDLPKLVEFISNYFCKQIVTIQINETIQGNYVRVPQSPSYFRVIKSPETEGRIYELDISFETDPTASNQQIVQSQIDPFPDQFTEYTSSEFYQIFDQNAIQSNIFPRKIYFIKPETTIDYIVKKNMNSTMDAIVSYVAVRGVNLGFNISLKACQTLKCQSQIAYYQSFYKKKQTDSLIIIPQEQDLSIFIAIGSTLASLACLCTLFIVGCRRYNSKQEQTKNMNQTNENDPLHQTIPTQQNIEQNLVPANSDKKMNCLPNALRRSQKYKKQDSSQKSVKKDKRKQGKSNKSNKSSKPSKSNKSNSSDSQSD